MSSNSSYQLKLYYWQGACSLAPHILLHELGIPFEAIRVEKTKDALEKNKHINPKLRVPVLVMDNEIITELPAIMTAISQFDKSRHLLGKSELETVRVYEWMNWLSGTMHGQAWASFLRPERFVDDEQAYGALRDKGIGTVKELNAIVESKLQGPHAVGDDLTIVDPFLYVFWRWGVTRGYIVPAQYPKFEQLARGIEERSSTQNVLEFEGITKTIARL